MIFIAMEETVAPDMLWIKEMIINHIENFE
jgi:hypothetical protein